MLLSIIILELFLLTVYGKGIKNTARIGMLILLSFLTSDAILITLYVVVVISGWEKATTKKPLKFREVSREELASIDKDFNQ